MRAALTAFLMAVFNPDKRLSGLINNGFITFSHRFAVSGCCDCAQHDGSSFYRVIAHVPLSRHSACFLLRHYACFFTPSLRLLLTPSLRLFLYPVIAASYSAIPVVPYPAIALAFLLRHSARSRGIQSMRVQSSPVLDAATARSMTGVVFTASLRLLFYPVIPRAVAESSQMRVQSSPILDAARVSHVIRIIQL